MCCVARASLSLCVFVRESLLLLTFGSLARSLSVSCLFVCPPCLPVNRFPMKAAGGGRGRRVRSGQADEGSLHRGGAKGSPGFKGKTDKSTAFMLDPNQQHCLSRGTGNCLLAFSSHHSSVFLFRKPLSGSCRIRMAARALGNWFILAPG